MSAHTFVRTTLAALAAACVVGVAATTAFAYTPTTVVSSSPPPFAFVPPPDLVVSSIDGLTPTAPHDCGLSFTITNVGIGAARSSTAMVYSGHGGYYEWASTPALAPGQSAHVSVTFYLYCDNFPRGYGLWIKADGFDNVNESNEWNNYASW